MRQEDEPENQVNLLVHDVNRQGAQARDLGNGGGEAKGIHRTHDDSGEHLGQQVINKLNNGRVI